MVLKGKMAFHVCKPFDAHIQLVFVGLFDCLFKHLWLFFKREVVRSSISGIMVMAMISFLPSDCFGKRPFPVPWLRLARSDPALPCLLGIARGQQFRWTGSEPAHTGPPPIPPPSTPLPISPILCS